MITGFADDPDRTIDPDALERLHRLGGARLVRQMVDLFQKHTVRHVTTLKASDDSGDLQGAELAAHSLKTSAGNLGATRLYQVALTVEEAAKRGDVGAFRALLSELREEFSRACEQLACVGMGLRDDDEADSDCRGQRGQQTTTTGDSRRALRSA